MKVALDVCCGPCFAGVYPQIKKTFDVLCYFNGDNLDSYEEYLRRKDSFLKAASYYEIKNYLYKEYNPDEYLSYVHHIPFDREGGDKCKQCFKYRLLQTSIIASVNSISFLTTTLSMSPYKHFPLIRSAADEVLDMSQNIFIPLHFYTKEGYLLSIEESKKLLLYRQNYCGCSDSKKKKRKYV